MKLFWQRLFHSIRGQLLTSFILMALLPALGIITGSIWSGFINGRQQVFNALETISSLKQIEIEGWLDEVKNETNAALTEEYAHDRMITALALATEDRYYRFFNGSIRQCFHLLVTQSRWLKALYLLDLQGKVVVATEDGVEGSDMSSLDCFQRTPTQPTFQISAPEGGQEAFLYVSIPVSNLSGNPMGFLVSRSDVGRVAEILQETTGMSSSGRAYLVYPDATSLTAGDILNNSQSVALQELHSEGIDTLLEERNTFSGIFRNAQGRRVLGVYRWLPAVRMGLVTEQNLTEAFSVVITSLNVTIWVALASLAGGILLALWLTRRIAHPLTLLAETAQKFSEHGLIEEVKIERNDEIGAFTRTFNTMTAQLGGLINQLEKRVVERTSELEEANQALNRRALQVETSFKVGQQITSILEIQPLLQRIVDLIRQSFNYEQVLIYLVEKENAQLVLQACSPLVGNRYRTLPINERSMNGTCAILHRAVVANDVRQNEHYLAEEELTVMSEMVIPLMVADEVIGTLDVESTQLNAFANEDVQALQNLADQIAIAIQNAYLYARTRELAVLEERNRLSRELHDSVIQSLYSLNLLAGGWQRLLESDQQLEIPQYFQKVRQISEQALREMRLLVHQLRPPVLEEVGLLDALHQRLDAVEKRAGIDARLVVEDVLELPFSLEEPLYWITQEALNNALKHASPRTVSVRLAVEDKKLALDVRDDGCGFDVSQAQRSGGMGLKTMQERAESISGSVVIQSAPGRGTTVRVTAPLIKG